MLKNINEPYTEYIFSLSQTKSRRVAIEWYITASGIMSPMFYRRDGRFANTNWSLEQAVKDYPNHPILRQMVEIDQMYVNQNQELPPLILYMINSWSCTTKQYGN